MNQSSDHQFDLTTASLLSKIRQQKEEETEEGDGKEGLGVANPENLLKNLSKEELELISKMYANGQEGAIGAESQQQKRPQKNKDFKAFLPEPGFCLKTKRGEADESGGGKVFLNICKSPEIGTPRDISEEELLKLIEQADGMGAFHFRVPLSLGEPHTELDNAGLACQAYDVCVSSDFFLKVRDSGTFLGFLVQIVIEGIEEKYKVRLDRNCKMLKVKKFMGEIKEQYVRIKSKPLIADMAEDEENTNTGSKNDNMKKPATEADERAKSSSTPKYKIMREPSDEIGPVEFLVAEIELPEILSASSLELEIGEDRVLLQTRSGVYFLDVYLPYSLNQEECGAQFDKKIKVLTVTMPVVAQ